MAPSDLQTLNQVLDSTLALLAQFTVALNPPSSSSTSSSSPNGSAAISETPIADPPNPLHVLRDAAALIKAHTTKLGLLAINKPFTPSALTKVVRELSATCLPALMSTTQIFAQEHSTWGTSFPAEARLRVRRVFREMETLLREIQTVARSGSTAATSASPRSSNNSRNNNSARRDSLAATGVVWESCDAVSELAAHGVAGLAVRKAEQWRATLQDAVDELREWREGTDAEAEGRRGDDSLLDSDDEGVAGDDDDEAGAAFEDLFNAANSLPADRPALRTLVQQAEAALKKVLLLYAALIKRRLKTFAAATAVAPAAAQGDVRVLDGVLAHLKRVPHLVDELAACFYDLEEERARAMLERCVDEARSARKLAALGWAGQEDEFTAWARKWDEAVG